MKEYHSEQETVLKHARHNLYLLTEKGEGLAKKGLLKRQELGTRFHQNLVFQSNI